VKGRKREQGRYVHERPQKIGLKPTSLRQELNKHNQIKKNYKRIVSVIFVNIFIA